MKKLSTISLLVFVIVSCSDNNSKYTHEHHESDCLESLKLLGKDESPGQIKLRIYIKSVQNGDNVLPVDTLILLNIDRESELIVFGESYALKFFHIEATEYGNLFHLVRYDLFIKETKFDCWLRRCTFNYERVKYFENNYRDGSRSFSVGIENSKDNIKVKWSLNEMK